MNVILKHTCVGVRSFLSIIIIPLCLFGAGSTCSLRYYCAMLDSVSMSGTAYKWCSAAYSAMSAGRVNHSWTVWMCDSTLRPRVYSNSKNMQLIEGERGGSCVILLRLLSVLAINQCMMVDANPTDRFYYTVGFKKKTCLFLFLF